MTVLPFLESYFRKKAKHGYCTLKGVLFIFIFKLVAQFYYMPP